MEQLRERAVLAALLLVESCWVFLLLGLLGFFMGDQGALLSWPGILLILALAAMTQLWAPRLRLPEGWTRTAAVALAGGLIYAMMAVHHGGLLWFNRLGESGQDPTAVPGLVMSFVASILLWWRGAQLAGKETPGETLWWEFPAVLVLLVFAAIIEATTEATLQGGPVAFVFFGAILAGLAIEHLEEPQGSSSRWTQTFAWTIGIVLLVGYITSLMSGSPLSALAVGLFGLMGWVARMLLALLFVPLGILMELFFSIFNTLWDWLLGGREFQFPEIQEFDPQELLEEAEENYRPPALLVSILKWTLIGLLVAGVLGLLYWALWLRLRRGGDSSGMVRESVREEASLEDLGTLLGSLLPRWRAREGPYMYPLPSGTDPGSRVRRAYYQLLNAATRRGQPRQPWETPLQFESHLGQQFAGLPAQEITESFDRVRFGLMPATAQEADWLEGAVRQALVETPGGDKQP